MSKRHTLECKTKLSARLLEINIFYDPKLDPMPKVHTTHLGGHVTHAIEVGSLTVVVSEGRANMAMEMIKDYEQEIRSARKSAKVKRPILAAESRTPFTDLQKELDEGMGLVGGALAIWFAILLGVGYFLLKYFS